jgi:membrane protein DedA with SNARE-associated domain
MTDAMTALALALGTLASEDLAAIGAAVLAAGGHVNTWVAMVAVAAGIYLGDLMLFACGRIGVTCQPVRRWIAAQWPSSDLDMLASGIDQRLALAVLTSRLVPGTRLPMYVAAGMFSRRPAAFCSWTLIAVALWTPLLMGGVLILGDAFAVTAQSYVEWAPLVVGLFVVQYAIRRWIAGRWR